MMKRLFKPSSYKDVFFDAHNNLSEPAKVIIRDLVRYTGFYSDKNPTDDVARWQGRRDVLNHIVVQLSVEEGDIVMFSGKDD